MAGRRLRHGLARTLPAFPRAARARDVPPPPLEGIGLQGQIATPRDLHRSVPPPPPNLPQNPVYGQGIRPPANRGPGTSSPTRDRGAGIYSDDSAIRAGAIRDTRVGCGFFVRVGRGLFCKWFFLRFLGGDRKFCRAATVGSTRRRGEPAGQDLALAWGGYAAGLAFRRDVGVGRKRLHGARTAALNAFRAICYGPRGGGPHVRPRRAGRDGGTDGEFGGSGGGRRGRLIRQEPGGGGAVHFSRNRLDAR